MKTIHNHLNLVSIFQVFSSLSLVSSLVSQGHAESILDALIGINQIETQTRLEWQSMTLVSSLPKLGSFFFKSTIYYTGRVGRPWQVQGTYLNKKKIETERCIQKGGERGEL